MLSLLHNIYVWEIEVIGLIMVLISEMKMNVRSYFWLISKFLELFVAFAKGSDTELL